MPEEPQDYYRSYYSERQKKNNYLLHAGLFLITFLTTTIAGTEWRSGILGPIDFDKIFDGTFIAAYLKAGLPYSIAIMFIISCHEFGHYFAAKYHKVDATLPYYIPFPSIPGFINFGTMGAVIRTKSPVRTKKAMFDIGVAGPLAGFVACLIVLVYGFITIPGKEYILAIHPDYFTAGHNKQGFDLVFGDNLIFSFLRYALTDHNSFFPPMSEIYHYPYLCVGWFGLFITAMNMIPVGQLDGGHIGYTVFGEKKHNIIAFTAFGVMLVLGLMGLLEMLLDIYTGIGWVGWLFWAVVLFFFIKIKHPSIPDETPLDSRRKIIGYLAFFIFIISFSPTPFEITGSF